ncbi:MAG: thioredoxin family protein [Opitutaceae bacterium]
MKKIQILGRGCTRCQKLATVAETAAKALGVPYELQKITDPQEILRLGVMTTPALVVDGKVRLAGRVPSVEEAGRLLGCE